MTFGAALRDDVKEAFARRLPSNLCCAVNLDAARRNPFYLRVPSLPPATNGSQETQPGANE